MSNTDRGTLKEVRDNVDKLGKVGDWKSLETIQETVPLDLKRKALARGVIQSKIAEDAIDDALKNTKKSANVDGKAGAKYTLYKAPGGRAGRRSIFVDDSLIGEVRKTDGKGSLDNYAVFSSPLKGDSKLIGQGSTQKAAVESALENKGESASADIDSDGKVEKDEKELVSAKAAVNVANSRRLNLDLTPDQPKLRDAHGHYLSKSEDLAEAVAEYKDNRDKTRLSSSEKKAVSSAAGVSSSDKRPSTARKGGRGKVRY